METEQEKIEMNKKRPKQLVTEEALIQILARLSLRNIARFRSVCKEWKSVIDSDFFRDLYESLNSSSSLSWSIMNTRNRTLSFEIVGHHGCERWELTNSIGSFITLYHPETAVKKTSVLSCADGLVLLSTETIEGLLKYHVGNPLLRQWVQIPLPPHLSVLDVVRLQENRLFTDSGLVTKMERGIAVAYKVVWMLASRVVSKDITFMIYSSETGLWETKKVRCPRAMIWIQIKYSVPLNGILHWLAASACSNDANYVVSYDFYNGGNGDDDLECRIIRFPGIERFEKYQGFKRTISTSAGSVVYCNVFSDNQGSRTIRVWTLVNYCSDDSETAWNLSWKLKIKSSMAMFGTNFFPVVMHPFKSEIIYLWSRKKKGLILLNLRTRRLHLYNMVESTSLVRKCMDGCIMTFNGCKEYMDWIYPIYSNNNVGGIHNLYFSQYVLPRWFNPLPRISS